MARLTLLLCLLGAAWAQESKYDRWIEQLGSEDPAKRQTARHVLLSAGTRALGEIDQAAAAAPDKATRDLLAAFAKAIRAREPHGLQFDAGMPRMRLILPIVNGEDFRYAVRVKYLGPQAAVLHGYLSLRVLDDQGAEVKPVRRLGRHGLRREGCFLEGVQFVTIEPGGTWAVQEGIHRYMHDPDVISGWKLEKPGVYTLEFTYRFDRAAFKQRCTCEDGAHDDEGKDWNKAIEMTHVFTAEMNVQ